MKSRVTLKELSKILNLSISTVSKSLSDSSEISMNTKKRVRDIALLHNYIPNIAAKNLKNQQTNIIGVIVPSLQSSFFSAVLEGIEAKADEMDYKIFLYISNESLEKERECIKKFVEMQVDGIIISPSQETQETGDIKHLEQLKAFGIPLVIFDRLIEMLDCDKVSIDNSFQSELAIREMHTIGCRKIAFISDLSESCVQNNRKTGYRVAANQLKLPVILFESNNIPFKKIGRLISEKKIDSVLACSDHSAISMMKCIRNAEPRILNQIPIVTFNKSFVSRNYLPAVNALDQKANEQGQLAIDTLVERISGNLPSEKMDYQINSNVIQLQSVKNRKLKFA